MLAVGAGGPDEGAMVHEPISWLEGIGNLMVAIGIQHDEVRVAPRVMELGAGGGVADAGDMVPLAVVIAAASASSASTGSSTSAS